MIFDRRNDLSVIFDTFGTQGNGLPARLRRRRTNRPLPVLRVRSVWRGRGRGRRPFPRDPRAMIMTILVGGVSRLGLALRRLHPGGAGSRGDRQREGRRPDRRHPRVGTRPDRLRRSSWSSCFCLPLLRAQPAGGGQPTAVLIRSGRHDSRSPLALGSVCEEGAAQRARRRLPCAAAHHRGHLRRPGWPADPGHRFRRARDLRGVPIGGLRGADGPVQGLEARRAVQPWRVGSHR